MDKVTLITSIITTTRHNVGDDFVRAGILSLLDDAVKVGRTGAPPAIKPWLIHKHSPITSVRGCSGIRSTRVSNLLEPVARQLRLPNAISSADLLIQSGAPIYWHHPGHSSCEANEWYSPLIRKRYCRLRNQVPLLNLAGGSCQSFHSDGSEFKQSPEALDYINDFFTCSALTTLRDPLAKQILALAGHHAEVLPCTSIFARDFHDINPRKGEAIVLNFMEGGGHFTFNQPIDKDAWRRNFSAIAVAAQELGPVVLACHNENEAALALELYPDYDRFIVPNDPISLMKFYSGSRFAVVNRVHAGFMLASLGKPVVVIGSDSRARMIEMLGLNAYFVNDVPDPQSLFSELLSLENNYLKQIESIRANARSRYLTLITPILESILDS